VFPQNGRVKHHFESPPDVVAPTDCRGLSMRLGEHGAMLRGRCVCPVAQSAFARSGDDLNYVGGSMRSRSIRSSKVALAIGALLLVQLSLAAGTGNISGGNRLGQSVLIGNDATEIVVYRFTPNRKELVPEPGRSQLFSTECEWSADDKGGIDCRKGTSSPLAGAVFSPRDPNSKRYTDSCGAPASILVCVSGCKPRRVPLILIRDAWEC
jgi:hypothetical protein